jgi:hypothetical protein
MHSTTASFGGFQVQADHVDQLVLELWVVGQLEGLHPMRLEPAGIPDPLHRRQADTDPIGNGATRPVGVTLGLGVQGQLDDLGDLLFADRGLAAAPPADLTQLGQPVLGEPVSPRADGADRDPIRCAMWLLATPSAASSSALARWTCRCGAACEATNPSDATR